MNNAFVERLRTAWENLNDRERRMLAILGAVAALLLLVLPPVVLALDNADLETENAELRSVLERLSMQHDKLQRLAKECVAMEMRYKNKTPPLGSFLEAEAKKQGLTLQEVTDKPAKSSGAYLRRSVTASLAQVQLTPVINLLSSIVDSPYPVAVDHIQVDHFQPGDQFNIKLGVVTFDKTGSDTLKSRTAAEMEAAETEGD
jgi:type II secretory pathway component PulM